MFSPPAHLVICISSLLTDYFTVSSVFFPHFLPPYPISALPSLYPFIPRLLSLSPSRVVESPLPPPPPPLPLLLLTSERRTIAHYSEGAECLDCLSTNFCH